MSELRQGFPRSFLVLFSILTLSAMAVGCSGDGGSGQASAAEEGEADLILTGATVRTVDPGNPVAEAVAITDGRITAVGSNAKAMGYAGPGTEVIELEGGAVVPGFVDSHLHAIEAGRFEELCFLPSGGGAGFYIRQVRKCARQQRGENWVRGAGPFVQDLIGLGIDPRRLLDRAVGNRPVLINDALGHAAFANSLALREAGIRDGDPDPRGGGYIRGRGGRINGVLLENAQNLASDAAEPPSADTRRRNNRALALALPQIAEEGITTVSDAGGYWPRQHPLAWKRAEQKGDLTTRASNALWVYPNRAFGPQVKEIEKLRYGNRNSLLQFNTVKIYVDGIVDYGSAALDRPYVNKPSWSLGGRRGFTYFSRRRLNRYVEEFDRLGFQVHLHVWGDRATRLALDSIKRARRLNGTDGGPHRITHVYLANDEDIPRLKQLGVTADMQSGEGAIDPAYALSLVPLIGGRDSAKLLPVGRLLGAGVNVGLSSDWDADTLSPLVNMRNFLGRKGGTEPFNDAATALEMVTINPARALDLESITGSIEVGKLADIAVLDGDPFKVDPANVGRIDVLLTLLLGNEVYRSPRFRP